MTHHFSTYDELDIEALFLRPIMQHPPWRRRGTEDIEDRGIRSMFRRYRPGTAPHILPSEMRAAVWTHNASIPDTLKQDEAARIRVVDHCALVLHLMARGPASSPNGMDFGKACSNAGLNDSRFARLMGTQPGRRLEALSRVMQRLDRAGHSLRWVADDASTRSRSWNAQLPSTDEVWPVLNFLFGYSADRSVARWAAGFYSTQQAQDEEGNSPQNEPA